MKSIVQWFVAFAALFWALAGVRAPRHNSNFDLVEFGRLPAIVNGRPQPLESVARNSLLILNGKQTARDENLNSLSAIQWFVRVTMTPEEADRLPVFRLSHPELKAMLALQPDGPDRIAFRDILPHLANIEQQAESVRDTDPKDRGSFDRAALRLNAAVQLYRTLRYTFQPESSTNLIDELSRYLHTLAEGVAAWKARQNHEPYDEQSLRRLHDNLIRFESVIKSDYLLVIPPTDPTKGLDSWQSFGGALFAMLSNTNVPKPVLTYATLATAVKANKPDVFNTAVHEYRQWLKERYPKLISRTDREYVYRNWQPFLKSMVLYGIALVMTICSWLVWFNALNRTAFGIGTVAFIVHTTGIVLRMAIEGRPPVTNLYSSAVFVGWGAAALGLVVERIQKDGVGLLLSGMAGLITLLIAHNLAMRGDTMEALRAVLDSNFWLATHVITITLGYSAMFVAGFIGVVYVLRGFLTRPTTPETQSRLPSIVYGTICFATLFSFVGTVLGGIWADQAWGRFWGWDPKENGALLVVLWCAIVLHTRAAGLVQERGLMNLAIFGNVVTAFSWFGVNMLGVGLHAYGFMEHGVHWLVLFVLVQLLIIGLGLLRKHHRPGSANDALSTTKSSQLA